MFDPYNKPRCARVIARVECEQAVMEDPANTLAGYEFACQYVEEDGMPCMLRARVEDHKDAQGRQEVVTITPGNEVVDLCPRKAKFVERVEDTAAAILAAYETDEPDSYEYPDGCAVANIYKVGSRHHGPQPDLGLAAEEVAGLEEKVLSELFAEDPTGENLPLLPHVRACGSCALTVVDCMSIEAGEATPDGHPTLHAAISRTVAPGCAWEFYGDRPPGTPPPAA